jgi:riboflavin biosynthesis pyrimidine reductase
MVAFTDLSRTDLEELYKWPTSVASRINLVVDGEGSTIGTDGSSNSLTSLHDRQILKLIRQGASLVIVGANSVRSEGWHIPSNGMLAVVSRNGLETLPPCPDSSRVFIGSLESVNQLAQSNTHWVCEGGRTVVESLLARDLIDEICLTLSPSMESQFTNPSLPRWIAEKLQFTAELKHAIRDGDKVFTLWRRGESQ